MTRQILDESHIHPAIRDKVSGHHADIALWRREQSLRLTLQRRPDLIDAARAAGLLSKTDEKLLATLLTE